MMTGGVAGARPALVNDTAGMRREIENVYNREPGASFAVAFEDLSTGQQLLLNAHTL